LVDPLGAWLMSGNDFVKLVGVCGGLSLVMLSLAPLHRLPAVRRSRLVNWWCGGVAIITWLSLMSLLVGVDSEPQWDARSHIPAIVLFGAFLALVLSTTFIQFARWLRD